MPDPRPLTYPLTRCPVCGALVFVHITDNLATHDQPGTTQTCPGSGAEVRP